MLTYAEVHYRPRFVPSLLYIKQPEIIFDAPTRINPGRPIPLFIFIKDANLFPVKIESVVVHAVYEGGVERVAQFPYYHQEIKDPFWWDSINIMPEFIGTVKLIPYLLIFNGKKTIPVKIDNYRSLTQSPLIVTVSEASYPGAAGWYHGDIHCHTQFTSDQIEFGAPLEAMALAGFSMGLNWIAATDHSYDLGNRMNDYTISDPYFIKWRVMRKVSDLLMDSFTIIPGEEVTCRTKNGRNCHMLALNSERFIKGTGDSGGNGLKAVTEHSIGEAAAMCTEWRGISCAAHPLEPVPLLERVILKRGVWSEQDMKTPGISGLQIHNGLRDKGFKEGYRMWIQLLLQGYRIFAFGGSDAHGDMNRRRSVGIPLICLDESLNHTVGCVRTVVYARSNKRDDLCTALSEGRALVTEGPFIDLTVSARGMTERPGGTITGTDMKIRAEFKSSTEFGALRSGRIYAGVTGEPFERTLRSLDGLSPEYEHLFEADCKINDIIYIRAECETDSGKLCFTNPVWIEGTE